MEITKVLGDNAGKLLALLDPSSAKLVGALAQLAVEFPKIKVGIAAGAGEPLALFDTIRADLDNPAIKGAFDAAGAGALLADLKAAAATFNGKLPDEVRVLLRRVGDYDEDGGTEDEGRMGWDKDGKVLEKTIGTDGKPRLGIGLTGAIAIDCEAGSRWFYPGDGVAAKGLVRLGIAGSIAGTVDGKVPFASLGSVAIAASAGAGADVHLFWRKNPDQLYAEALGEIVASPVNVFSLADVWEAARDRSFEGFVVKLDGHATLQVDLGLAREFDVDGLLKAKAGITVSVDLARKASYELSVRKVDEGLRMVLSHGDEDSAKWGLGVGIEIDPSPLVRRVGKVVADATDHWDEVLGKVRPFLSPGTWLREELAGQVNGLLGKLEQQVNNPVLLDGLKRDLRLALGEDSDDAGLAGTLAGKVTDAVGSLERVVTGKADDLAATAILKLTGRLPGLLAEPVAAALKAEVAKLIQALQKDFEGVVGEVVSANPVTAIDRALKKAGQEVTAAASKLDARAKAIRDLVGKADDLVHKIAKAVEEAATARIALQLRFENSRIDKSQFEFTGDFLAVNPQTSALYRSLMTGELSRLTSLFERPVDGFALDPKRSSVRRFSQSKSTVGYALVILGLEFGGSETVSGSADVTWRADGKIEVNARAFYARAAGGWRQKRSIEFVETYRLVVARVMESLQADDAATGMTLDLSTERSDKDLRIEEIEKYLRRMVDAQLISGARVDAMTAYRQEVAKMRGQQKIPGALEISMTMSEADLARLLALGGEIGSAPRGPAARNTFELALRIMNEAGDWSDKRMIDWLKDNFDQRPAKNLTDDETARAWRSIMFAALDVKLEEPSGAMNAGDLATFHFGEDRQLALKALLHLLDRIAAIRNATPATLSDTNAAHWQVGQYRAASKAVAADASQWLELNQKAIFFFDPKIDKRTVSFMRILAELARGAPSAGKAYDDMFAISLAFAAEDPSKDPVPKAF